MEPNSEMALSLCPIFVLSAEFPAPAGMSGIRQAIDPSIFSGAATHKLR